MHLAGRGIGRGPRLDDRLQLRDIVEIGVSRWDWQIEHRTVAIDLALAGGGENDELVAEVATDGSSICAHGDRGQSESLERAQIGNEHLL